MEKINVIYVLSSGHSGSTLLDLLLGSHSAVESVGEIHSFSKYFSPNPPQGVHAGLCTCGAAVKECNFWSRVKKHVAEHFGAPNPRINSADRQEFEEANGNLFAGILNVSGRAVVCDSSKNFKRLLRLSRSSRFSVHVVHLVRDGRAVAYSNMKKKRGHFLRALFWQRNIGYSLRLQFMVRRKQIRVTQLKYEELAESPSRALTKILAKHGLQFESDQLRFSEHEHHNLGGNRMRWNKGQAIRPSREYIEKLSLRDWVATTLLSLGALVWFGYSIRRPARPVEEFESAGV